MDRAVKRSQEEVVQENFRPTMHQILCVCVRVFSLCTKSTRHLHSPADGKIATRQKRRQTWRASASVRNTCFFIMVAHRNVYVLISPLFVHENTQSIWVSKPTNAIKCNHSLCMISTLEQIQCATM